MPFTALYSFTFAHLFIYDYKFLYIEILQLDCYLFIDRFSQQSRHQCVSQSDRQRVGQQAILGSAARGNAVEVRSDQLRLERGQNPKQVGSHYEKDRRENRK